jgi:hypothetical protein
VPLTPPPHDGVADQGQRAGPEEALRLALGGGISVVEATRRPNEFSTLFPSDILHLELSSGEELFLFAKQLTGEQVDHPDKLERRREAWVYENLLSDSALPVPRWFGLGQNPATGCQELYLEYLDGLSLRYQGLEHWFPAARRLADLHLHFAARSELLRSGGFLLELNERYFEAWAERAVSAVGAVSAGLATRLEHVVSSLEPALAVIVAQPCTLVHNDLSPKNVIAVTTSRPPRIAFVDWELAGVGCGVLDLVHLKYGLGADDDRRMRETYWERLADSELAPKSTSEQRSLLGACELHKTLYRLAHIETLRSPPRTVAQWVEDAERFRRAV